MQGNLQAVAGEICCPRMPLAIENYEYSIFLHVAAVVVGFGATFSESVMFPVAMKMSARNLP